MSLPSGWKEVGRPEEFAKAWRERFAGEVAMPRFFHHRDGRVALLGREPYGGGALRWHLSVRVGDPGVDGRIPTWEELVNTAHELRPGVPFVMSLPPRSWWINVHPNVLHLFETFDKDLVDQWRADRQGDRPT